MTPTGTQSPDKQGPQVQEPVSQRRLIAGIVALVALAVVTVAWFWMTRQPAEVTGGIGAPQGVIVVGAGTFLAALIASIRNMGVWDVLEMIWEGILGLFSLIGALLKGLWSLIAGLFGWD